MHQRVCRIARTSKGSVNDFKVGHNAFEFLLVFGQLYPQNQEAQFHTRIITVPIYAKALLELRHDSIHQNEQTFGAIAGG